MQNISLEGKLKTSDEPEVSSLGPTSCGQAGCSTVPTELIQTELHHVRTLKIMTRLFRTGMLEELQLEPGVVQGLFPCVDELTDIHTRFLSQLLDRRRQALCPGSTRNFVIHRLGDLLISQVRKARTPEQQSWAGLWLEWAFLISRLWGLGQRELERQEASLFGRRQEGIGDEM